ncbi:30S ribosomal protein S8e, partial [Candidatus Woesearchaeota archaeon]
MSFWQGRSKRKASGGKYSSVKKKKSRVIGRDPLYARLGNKLKKVVLR